VLIVVAAALGLAAVFGLSLVLKLRSIRRRGFGEGSRLEIPEAGITLRHPSWWTRSARPATAPAPIGPNGAVVDLKTGHFRGVLRITAWREEGATAAPEGYEADLRVRLANLLREQGLELDDPEIRTAHAGPKPDGGGQAGRPLRVWVGSGGKQASRPEERSYFEVHFVAMEGAGVVFSYRNSVLQGFLDAYYIEKVLETLQPARSAPTAPAR